MTVEIKFWGIYQRQAASAVREIKLYRRSLQFTLRKAHFVPLRDFYCCEHTNCRTAVAYESKVSINTELSCVKGGHTLVCERFISFGVFHDTGLSTTEKVNRERERESHPRSSKHFRLPVFRTSFAIGPWKRHETLSRLAYVKFWFRNQY